MENTDESPNPKPPIKALRPDWWSRFVSYVKCKFQERRTKKENETPADRAARVTATATYWMALFTFVLAIVGVLTLCVLRNQLKEMHEGGVDTHDLAVAAKTQAEKMKDMSDAADKIRKAAEGMVTQEQRIADNAKESLDISSRQNKAALDATIKNFQQEQRAWLYISCRPPVQETVTETSIWTECTLVNEGKTPGFNAVIQSRFAIWKPPGLPEPDWTKMQKGDPEMVPPGIPHAIQFTTGPEPVPKQVMDDYKNGRKTIYIWFLISYNDIFHKPHWTKVCAYRDVSLHEYRLCPTGSGTDDENENGK